MRVDHDYVLNAAQLAKAGGTKHFQVMSTYGANHNSTALYTRTKVSKLCLHNKRDILFTVNIKMSLYCKHNNITIVTITSTCISDLSCPGLLSLNVTQLRSQLYLDALGFIFIQCSPFIIYLVITQIWILHGHAVAPKYLPWNFTKQI